MGLTRHGWQRCDHPQSSERNDTTTTNTPSIRQLNNLRQWLSLGSSIRPRTSNNKGQLVMLGPGPWANFTSPIMLASVREPGGRTQHVASTMRRTRPSQRAAKKSDRLANPLLTILSTTPSVAEQIVSPGPDPMASIRRVRRSPTSDSPKDVVPLCFLLKPARTIAPSWRGGRHEHATPDSVVGEIPRVARETFFVPLAPRVAVRRESECGGSRPQSKFGRNRAKVLPRDKVDIVKPLVEVRRVAPLRFGRAGQMWPFRSKPCQNRQT